MRPRHRQRAHVHRWLIRKYGVRVYEDGRRRTVVFLNCAVCSAQRSKAIARRELSVDELNAFALKHYRQTTAFTGHGSDRPAGHEL